MHPRCRQVTVGLKRREVSKGERAATRLVVTQDRRLPQGLQLGLQFAPVQLSSPGFVHLA
jgi:hypothetical protein